jgi:aminoglycoside phosphotransferase (APT) family kinase protein
VPPVRNRDVLRQARLLRALHLTDVPVPEVLCEDPGSPPDVPPLFVMEFVEGASLEPLFDRQGNDHEEKPLVAERMRNAARLMGALHALEPESLELGDEPSVTLADEIERWCRPLDTVDQALVPDWESVADALRAAQSSPLPPTVLHGDLRLGNMLATGTRIAAIIDWEIWSVGDPRVDVGWFLANADPATYRRRTPYSASLPSVSELAAIYGRAVTDLDWFRALACFKSAATWGLIIKHNRRREGPEPAIEEMADVLPHLLERARQLVP